MSASASLSAGDIPRRAPSLNRWVHLAVGVVALMAIANVQFAVSRFASQPGEGLLGAITGVQSAFAAFLFVETLLVPMERWLVDRLGARPLLALGGALCVGSWLGTSRAGGDRALLAWLALGGLGAGLFYAGSVARALERFPDHWGRPLAAAAGACLLGISTAWPIAAAMGLPYAPALLPWDLAQAALVLVAAVFVLKPPPPEWEPPA